MGGRVFLGAFKALMENSAGQDNLKDGARTVFRRLGQALEKGALEAAIRRYAEAPIRPYMRFHRFASMVKDVDPSLSADVNTLWCVLEKEDQSEDALVKVQELVRWMDPCISCDELAY